MTRLPGDRAAPAPRIKEYASLEEVERDHPKGTEVYEAAAWQFSLPGVVAVRIRTPRPYEPLSCGYNADADELSGEVYNVEMHEISGNHIGVNPDGTITPFRSGRDGRPN